MRAGMRSFFRPPLPVRRKFDHVPYKPYQVCVTYRIPENRRESSIFLSIICDYELEKKNSVGRQCPALMFLHIVHYSGMSSLFVYFRYDCMVRMRACVRAWVRATTESSLSFITKMIMEKSCLGGAHARLWPREACMHARVRYDGRFFPVYR